MIIVKGYGQMCNNIIQFAHLYAFGLEYGKTVISMRFSYKYRYFSICNRWYHNFFTYLLVKLLIKTHIIKCIKEDNTPQIDMMLRQTPLIASVAWGCRYPELFLKYRNEIKSIFEIRENIVNRVAHWMEQYPKADIRLGLHIRRGDYAKWQGGKYFFPDEVYFRLIKDFCDLHKGQSVCVFICTNDKRLDIRSYKAIHKETYLSHGSGIEDLQLLSQCDYIMGVKSTFSLWASFYNDRPLYWIMDKDKPLKEDSFVKFEEVFTTI